MIAASIMVLKIMGQGFFTSPAPETIVQMDRKAVMH